MHLFQEWNDPVFIFFFLGYRFCFVIRWEKSALWESSLEPSSVRHCGQYVSFSPFFSSFEIGLTVSNSVPGSRVNDPINYLSEFSQGICSWVIVLPLTKEHLLWSYFYSLCFLLWFFYLLTYCLEISSYPACMLLFLIVYILGSVKTTLHSTTYQERGDLSKILSHGLAW